jgi:DNA-binding response OmpR family regulator
MGATRLLIVDDDPEMLDCLQEALRDTFEVSIAFEGTSALHAMEQTRFDVVLLDLNMPGLDGFELLTQLAAQPSHPRVVIASGFPSLDRIAAKYGADGWLAKPYSLALLEQCVARAARAGRVENGGHRAGPKPV